MSKWTPGMSPINDRTVLVTDGETVAIAWWSEIGTPALYAVGKNVSQMFQYRPTHWMPLPQMPESGD